jgi:hypothetical protein
MGTPFIGQHDKAQVSTILFLSWLNTFLLSSVIVFLIIWTQAR